MCHALLRILQAQPPGLTQSEMFVAILPHLLQDLFPGGAKTGGWTETVQLDLEARGQVASSATRLACWRRC